MPSLFRRIASMSIAAGTFAAGSVCCAQHLAWPAASVSQPGSSLFDATIQFSFVCAASSNPLSGHLSICPAVFKPATQHGVPFLPLNAATALVIEQREWRPLYSKEAETIRPIASITKLMSAMVVIDAGSPLDEVIQIDKRDVDVLKSSGSRLRIGIRLRRDQLLDLALMASENRAAAALARRYPGGSSAFVAAMNRKAQALGMSQTHFVDATGLNPANVSSAHDLAIMANAAFQYPAIREATTAREHWISVSRGRHMRMLAFHNSNQLVSREDWQIGLSKTGYIREAGRCLVMQTTIGDRAVIIVLLDSLRKATRLADADSIKQWLSSARE